MARITEGEHRSMDGSINTKPVIHSKAGAILQNVTLLLMVLVASGGAIGQSAQTPALTNIVLLPGYVNTSTRPMDSAFSGTISKQHGLVISYDIGLTAGRYDTDPRWNRRAVWQTEQVLNGKRVVCIFTGSKELLISFPESLANFHAKIRSERDLADMLLMVLTYVPN